MPSQLPEILTAAEVTFKNFDPKNSERAPVPAMRSPEGTYKPLSMIPINQGLTISWNPNDGHWPA